MLLLPNSQNKFYSPKKCQVFLDLWPKGDTGIISALKMNDSIICTILNSRIIKEWNILANFQKLYKISKFLLFVKVPTDDNCLFKDDGKCWEIPDGLCHTNLSVENLKWERKCQPLKDRCEMVWFSFVMHDWKWKSEHKHKKIPKTVMAFTHGTKSNADKEIKKYSINGLLHLKPI